MQTNMSPLTWMTRGAFHSTKISGNFGLKLNGTVRSNRKSFEKIGPPLEVDHFFRLDRSDRNGPFHLTIPTHSQSQYLAVGYFHVQHELTWRKTLSMQLLWIVNSGSIGDTHTSTCSYNRSGAASQAKGMFWLLTALKYVKDDLFPKRIWNVLFVVRKWCLNSYGKYLGTILKIRLRLKQLTQYH